MVENPVVEQARNASEPINLHLPFNPERTPVSMTATLMNGDRSVTVNAITGNDVITAFKKAHPDLVKPLTFWKLAPADDGAFTVVIEEARWKLE